MLAVALATVAGWTEGGRRRLDLGMGCRKDERERVLRERVLREKLKKMESCGYFRKLYGFNIFSKKSIKTIQFIIVLYYIDSLDYRSILHYCLPSIYFRNSLIDYKIFINVSVYLPLRSHDFYKIQKLEKIPKFHVSPPYIA